MKSAPEPRTARLDDPRAERTRSALLAAAVDVVTDRNTTEVPLSEIARAAGVSRQAAYLHYRDLSELLLDAAIDLLESEVDPASISVEQPRQVTLRMTAHFARHRAFYRAMLSGRSAYALHLRILRLLRPSAPQGVLALEPRVARDLGDFVTGGAGTIINAWVLDTEDPSTPEQLADRIEAVVDVLSRDNPLPR